MTLESQLFPLTSQLTQSNCDWRKPWSPGCPGQPSTTCLSYSSCGWPTTRSHPFIPAVLLIWRPCGSCVWMEISWQLSPGKGLGTCPAFRHWDSTTTVCPASLPTLHSFSPTSPTLTSPATGVSNFWRSYNLVIFNRHVHWLSSPLFRLTLLSAELLDLWFPFPGQQGGPVQRRILGMFWVNRVIKSKLLGQFSCCRGGAGWRLNPLHLGADVDHREDQRILLSPFFNNAR